MELIGRAAELDELVSRCDSHRLVTVVGPGGVGKTRLAHAAAERLAAQFPNGTSVVDMAAVTDPRRVALELAAQLGFATVDAMLSSPVDLPVLVVVDSCEHVLDAVAEAVTELLASCDAPTVLATSRSPLDLPGESVVVLGPLATVRADSPGATAGAAGSTATGTVAEATEPWSPAAELFRARARDAGVRLGTRDRDDVELLCRSLDGLPLAIEIAAARSRLLGSAELVRTLDVGSLSRPRFRGSERHRSLHATIDWSYRLLDEDSRELFDRLGVLSGEFLPEGASAVSAPGAPVLDRVDTLLAASLLVADQRDGVTWLRQLDTVRAFAQARLRESGRWEATWGRFVDYVVDRVRPTAVGELTPGRWESSALSRLVERHARVLETLRWTVEHDEAPDRVLILLGALWQTVHLGRLDEALELSEIVIERWGIERPAGWVEAAATVAACRFLVGDPVGAATLAGELADSAEEPVASLALRCTLGQCAALNGDFAGAHEHFDAAATTAARAGAETIAVEMRVFTAGASLGAGRADEALAELAAARRLVDPSADRLGVWIETIEGHALLEGAPDRALESARATLDAARRADFPACEVTNLHTMARAALTLGREHDAVTWCLDAVGRLALRGAVSETRPVLRLAASLLERRGTPGWPELAATVTAMASSSIIDLAAPAADPPPGARTLSRGAAISFARRSLTLAVAGEVAPARPGDGSAAEGRGTDSGGERGSLRRTGEGWEASFAGRDIVLKDSKGLRDLAVLLARPGREVHCAELAGVAVEQGDTGELIDGQARRAYEARIRELYEVVEEATADHDLARAEAAQRELDEIVDHLSSALGLRGSRKPGSSTERARSTVTQRVRATVRRMAAVHPELARHLEVSIVTGTYCSYRPEREVAWLVEPRV